MITVELTINKFGVVTAYRGEEVVKKEYLTDLDEYGNPIKTEGEDDRREM